MTDEQQPDELDTIDFDAFWRKHTAKTPRKALRLFGETFPLPKALPLRFELEGKRLRKSRKSEDVGRLVDILLGDGAYERLVAKGLDADQFAVLLAFIPQHIHGVDVTLEQVAADLAAMEAGQGEA